VVVQQYPALVPDYPPVASILDTSYVQDLAQRRAPTTAAELPHFDVSQHITSVVSRRSWSINFQTGSAEFDPTATAALEPLLRDLLVAGSTAVEVHGHTDAAGNADANRTLSESRAFAVKQWLEQHAPSNFPEGRIRVFAHGSENPIAPNSTAEGRARNRRVEIVLGTTETH
jgi:outer membrane protein OmpA-like peptidoglycan-associated protein